MWPTPEVRIQQKAPLPPREENPFSIGQGAMKEFKWPMSINEAFNYTYLTEEQWKTLFDETGKHNVQYEIISYTNQYEATVERIRKNVLEDLATKYIYPYPYKENDESNAHSRNGRFMSLYPTRRSYYMHLDEALKHSTWAEEKKK